MDAKIAEVLSTLEFGEIQQFKNMAVVPLFSPVNHSPDYLTLKEALEKQVVTITELTEGGSVPQLKVKNDADVAVLLLDGEELAGAKQNRVLNTSILVKNQSELVVPVSCTEQGRWSYSSANFSDSGEVMMHSMRSMKLSKVTESLETTKTYASDQGEVWGEIERLHAKAGTSDSSRTRAMHDSYAMHSNDLDDYLKAFQLMPNQRGVLMLIKGQVMGFDLLSRPGVYEILHPKLIRSYAIDAVLNPNVEGEQAAPPSLESVKAFIKDIAECKEDKYESVGEGWDHRYQSKAIVGSALEYDQKVIHMAFFKAPEAKDGPSSRSRRFFRQRPDDQASV
jgi:hypothetical protein